LTVPVIKIMCQQKTGGSLGGREKIHDR
jgi:hypothetical protein